jgi:hypothetical protein
MPKHRLVAYECVKLADVVNGGFFLAPRKEVASLPLENLEANSMIGEFIARHIKQGRQVNTETLIEN